MEFPLKIIVLQSHLHTHIEINMCAYINTQITNLCTPLTGVLVAEMVSLISLYFLESELTTYFSPPEISSFFLELKLPGLQCTDRHIQLFRGLVKLLTTPGMYTHTQGLRDHLRIIHLVGVTWIKCGYGEVI